MQKIQQLRKVAKMSKQTRAYLQGLQDSVTTIRVSPMVTSLATRMQPNLRVR